MKFLLNKNMLHLYWFNDSLSFTIHNVQKCKQVTAISQNRKAFLSLIRLIFRPTLIKIFTRLSDHICKVLDPFLFFISCVRRQAGPLTGTSTCTCIYAHFLLAQLPACAKRASTLYLWTTVIDTFFFFRLTTKFCPV